MNEYAQLTFSFYIAQVSIPGKGSTRSVGLPTEMLVIPHKYGSLSGDSGSHQVD